MTKAETVKLFALIAASYPRDTAFSAADAQMVGVWQEMLNDVAFDLAKAVVQAHVANSPFPPSIAEIRQWAAKVAMPTLDTDQAWDQIIAAIKSHGYYDASGAKAALPAELWDTVNAVWYGWQNLCTSEDMSLELSRFSRYWEARNKRYREMAVLPESLRTAIAAPAQKALTGGELC